MEGQGFHLCQRVTWNEWDELARRTIYSAISEPRQGYLSRSNRRKVWERRVRGWEPSFVSGIVVGVRTYSDGIANDHGDGIDYKADNWYEVILVTQGLRSAPRALLPHCVHPLDS